MITFYIILGVIVLIILFAIGSFNRLVRMSVRAKEAWADIDVQLKRRYDLIPNLVQTVKGYAEHEKTAFENVTQARAAAMGAQGVAGKAQAENMLSQSLKSLFAVAEAYPELKANQNFLALQNELTDTEDKIQAARRFYNVNVRDLNASVQTFPGNMVAGVFHISTMEFFELGGDETAAREPVKVEF